MCQKWSKWNCQGVSSSKVCEKDAIFMSYDFKKETKHKFALHKSFESKHFCVCRFPKWENFEVSRVFHKKGNSSCTLSLKLWAFISFLSTFPFERIFEQKLFVFIFYTCSQNRNIHRENETKKCFGSVYYLTNEISPWRRVLDFQKQTERLSLEKSKKNVWFLSKLVSKETESSFISRKKQRTFRGAMKFLHENFSLRVWEFKRNCRISWRESFLFTNHSIFFCSKC